jgi:hypothetical protein
MSKHVNTVIVGSSVGVSAAPTVGQIVLLGSKGQILATPALAGAEPTVSIAVVTGTMKIVDPTKTDGSMITKPMYKQSNPIQKTKLSLKEGTYAAPIPSTAVFTMTGASIVAGNRYVIRIVYKDIVEHPSQFTHSYEIIATTTVASDLAAAFAAKINRHKGRRVTAGVSAAVLTLTALEVDDNVGTESINEYSIVHMDPTFYYTSPSAGITSSKSMPVSGAVTTTTVGTPGKGYWKQVRDMEQRARGYAGVLYTGAYPLIQAPKYVVEGATYNYVTAEYENMFLSADNQYIKNTPLAVNVFCIGATTSLTAMLVAFKGQF